MKTTILGILGVALGINCSQAAISDVEFSYAGDDISLVSAYGSNGSERQSMAIKIADPILAGYKITNIKAYMSEKGIFTRPEIWLSSQLKVEKRQNAPDIMSQEVTAVAGEYNGLPCQVLEYNFTEPYEIGADGVYVGSSVTTSIANSSETTPAPFLIYDSMNPNGFWYFGTTSAQSWTDMSSTGKVAMIVVSLVGESDVLAVNLDRLEDLYVSKDEKFITTGFVTNAGGQPVNSLEYSYTVDGDNAGAGTITFDEPLLPNPGKSVSVSFEFNGISSYKEHDVVVTIDKLNGQANLASSPSASFTPYVVLFIPEHRPLVEEYTGLWCQWCPRGYVAMEEVGAHFKNMAVVCCFHNNDPMAITSNYPLDFSGFPKASVDRLAPVDPYTGGYGADNAAVPGIFKLIDSRIEQMPIAAIDVANLSSDDFGISFDIKTVFCVEPKSSQYEVGYIITANGLSDPDWGQVNAYSGMGGYTGSPLEMFTKLGPRAYGLVYNDVVVNAEAMNGIPGSLPTIEMGETYVKSITIPKSGIFLTSDLDSLVVNVFIVDKSTGFIVNANKAYVSESSNPDAGVEGIYASSVVSREYYDLSGRKVENPSKGIYIVKSLYEDGKIKTEKLFLNE